MKLSNLIVNIVFVLVFILLLMFFLMDSDSEKGNNMNESNNVIIEEFDDNIDVIEVETSYDESSDDEVFVFVEDQPEYPGGDEARLRFLSDNIFYPEMAKESGIMGTVYITFVVEKDGRVTNVEVLRGIGGGCDEAAVNAISKMPRWKPGFQKGKAVRAQFNMPVKFILAD